MGVYPHNLIYLLTVGMDAFKYGIGEPGRSLSNQFTPESRPMFRNAMTRMMPIQKIAFVKEYFTFKNPVKAEEFAKIFVNSLPKLVLKKKPTRFLTLKHNAKLNSIPENAQLRKSRKQKTRKNRK